MSPLLGHSGARRLGHIPPRLSRADWWVLTTADAAGTNGLTYLPKHGQTQDRRLLVDHPMTDHCESLLLYSFLHSEAYMHKDTKRPGKNGIIQWPWCYQTNNNGNCWSNSFVNSVDHQCRKAVEFNQNDYKSTITIIGHGREIFDIIDELRVKNCKKDIRVRFLLERNGQIIVLKCIKTNLQLLKEVLDYHHIYYHLDEYYHEGYKKKTICCYNNMIMIPSKEDSDEHMYLDVYNKQCNLNNQEEYTHYPTDGDSYTNLLYNNDYSNYKTHVAPKCFRKEEFYNTRGNHYGVLENQGRVICSKSQNSLNSGIYSGINYCAAAAEECGSKFNNDNIGRNFKAKYDLCNKYYVCNSKPAFSGQALAMPSTANIGRISINNNDFVTSPVYENHNIKINDVKSISFDGLNCVNNDFEYVNTGNQRTTGKGSNSEQFERTNNNFKTFIRPTYDLNRHCFVYNAKPINYNSFGLKLTCNNQLNSNEKESFSNANNFVTNADYKFVNVKDDFYKSNLYDNVRFQFKDTKNLWPHINYKASENYCVQNYKQQQRNYVCNDFDEKKIWSKYKDSKYNCKYDVNNNYDCPTEYVNFNEYKFNEKNICNTPCTNHLSNGQYTYNNNVYRNQQNDITYLNSIINTYDSHIHSTSKHDYEYITSNCNNNNKASLANTIEQAETPCTYNIKQYTINSLKTPSLYHVAKNWVDKYLCPKKVNIKANDVFSTTEYNTPDVKYSENIENPRYDTLQTFNINTNNLNNFQIPTLSPYHSAMSSPFDVENNVCNKAKWWIPIPVTPVNSIPCANYNNVYVTGATMPQKYEERQKGILCICKPNPCINYKCWSDTSVFMPDHSVTKPQSQNTESLFNSYRLVKAPLYSDTTTIPDLNNEQVCKEAKSFSPNYGIPKICNANLYSNGINEYSSKTDSPTPNPSVTTSQNVFIAPLNAAAYVIPQVKTDNNLVYYAETSLIPNYDNSNICPCKNNQFTETEKLPDISVPIPRNFHSGNLNNIKDLFETSLSSIESHPNENNEQVLNVPKSFSLYDSIPSFDNNNPCTDYTHKYIVKTNRLNPDFSFKNSPNIYSSYPNKVGKVFISDNLKTNIHGMGPVIYSKPNNRIQNICDANPCKYDMYISETDKHIPDINFIRPQTVFPSYSITTSTTQVNINNEQKNNENAYNPCYNTIEMFTTNDNNLKTARSSKYSPFYTYAMRQLNNDNKRGNIAMTWIPNFVSSPICHSIPCVNYGNTYVSSSNFPEKNLDKSGDISNIYKTITCNDYRHISNANKLPLDLNIIKPQNQHSNYLNSAQNLFAVPFNSNVCIPKICNTNLVDNERYNYITNTNNVIPCISTNEQQNVYSDNLHNAKDLFSAPFEIDNKQYICNAAKTFTPYYSTPSIKTNPYTVDINKHISKSNKPIPQNIYSEDLSYTQNHFVLFSNMYNTNSYSSYRNKLIFNINKHSQYARFSKPQINVCNSQSILLSPKSVVSSTPKENLNNKFYSIPDTYSWNKNFDRKSNNLNYAQNTEYSSFYTPAISPQFDINKKRVCNSAESLRQDPAILIPCKLIPCVHSKNTQITNAKIPQDFYSKPEGIFRIYKKKPFSNYTNEPILNYINPQNQNSNNFNKLQNTFITRNLNLYNKGYGPSKYLTPYYDIPSTNEVKPCTYLINNYNSKPNKLTSDIGFSKPLYVYNYNTGKNLYSPSFNYVSASTTPKNINNHPEICNIPEVKYCWTTGQFKTKVNNAHNPKYSEIYTPAMMSPQLDTDQICNSNPCLDNRNTHTTSVADFGDKSESISSVCNTNPCVDNRFIIETNTPNPNLSSTKLKAPYLSDLYNAQYLNEIPFNPIIAPTTAHKANIDNQKTGKPILQSFTPNYYQPSTCKYIPIPDINEMKPQKPYQFNPNKEINLYEIPILDRNENGVTQENVWTQNRGNPIVSNVAPYIGLRNTNILSSILPIPHTSYLSQLYTTIKPNYNTANNVSPRYNKLDICNSVPCANYENYYEVSNTNSDNSVNVPHNLYLATNSGIKPPTSADNRQAYYTANNLSPNYDAPCTFNKIPCKDYGSRYIYQPNVQTPGISSSKHHNLYSLDENNGQSEFSQPFNVANIITSGLNLNNKQDFITASKSPPNNGKSYICNINCVPIKYMFDTAKPIQDANLYQYSADVKRDKIQPSYKKEIDVNINMPLDNFGYVSEKRGLDLPCKQTMYINSKQPERYLESNRNIEYLSGALKEYTDIPLPINPYPNSKFSINYSSYDPRKPTQKPVKFRPYKTFLKTHEIIPLNSIPVALPKMYNDLDAVLFSPPYQLRNTNNRLVTRPVNYISSNSESYPQQYIPKYSVLSESIYKNSVGKNDHDILMNNIIPHQYFLAKKPLISNIVTEYDEKEIPSFKSMLFNKFGQETSPRTKTILQQSDNQPSDFSTALYNDITNINHDIKPYSIDNTHIANVINPSSLPVSKTINFSDTVGPLPSQIMLNEGVNDKMFSDAKIPTYNIQFTPLSDKQNTPPYKYSKVFRIPSKFTRFPTIDCNYPNLNHYYEYQPKNNICDDNFLSSTFDKYTDNPWSLQKLGTGGNSILSYPKMKNLYLDVDKTLPMASFVKQNIPLQCSKYFMPDNSNPYVSTIPTKNTLEYMIENNPTVTKWKTPNEFSVGVNSNKVKTLPFNWYDSIGNQLSYSCIPSQSALKTVNPSSCLQYPHITESMQLESPSAFLSSSSNDFPDPSYPLKSGVWPYIPWKVEGITKPENSVSKPLVCQNIYYNPFISSQKNMASDSPNFYPNYKTADIVTPEIWKLCNSLDRQSIIISSLYPYSTRKYTNPSYKFSDGYKLGTKLKASQYQYLVPEREKSAPQHLFGKVQINPYTQTKPDFQHEETNFIEFEVTSPIKSSHKSVSSKPGKTLYFDGSVPCQNSVNFVTEEEVSTHNQKIPENGEAYFIQEENVKPEYNSNNQQFYNRNYVTFIPCHGNEIIPKLINSEYNICEVTTSPADAFSSQAFYPYANYKQYEFGMLNEKPCSLNTIENKPLTNRNIVQYCDWKSLSSNRGKYPGKVQFINNKSYFNHLHYDVNVPLNAYYNRETNAKIDINTFNYPYQKSDDKLYYDEVKSYVSYSSKDLTSGYPSVIKGSHQRNYWPLYEANTYTLDNNINTYALNEEPYQICDPLHKPPVTINSFPTAKLFYTTICKNVAQSNPRFDANNKADLPKALTAETFSYIQPISDTYSKYFTTYSNLQKSPQIVFPNVRKPACINANVISFAEPSPLCVRKDFINGIKKNFVTENVIKQLYDVCSPITIDLGEIGIAKCMPETCENQFTIKTEDPNIEVKAWRSKFKVIKAHIIIDTDEYSVTNFVPIVKCKFNTNYDTIQNIVKDVIIKHYGRLILVKDFTSYPPYAVLCDINSLDLSNNNFNILWPVYDEACMEVIVEYNHHHKEKRESEYE
ncbi:hypothetical protein evm_008928 [Chilo suppressalis]|nr:hypothetical protein evm_008928 [Chilo suppressalis]